MFFIYVICFDRSHGMENDDEEYGKEGLSDVHSFAYETRVCWQRYYS